MLPEPETPVAELEWALRRGASERRVDTLRQVTDLFLSEAAASFSKLGPETASGALQYYRLSEGAARMKFQRVG